LIQRKAPSFAAWEASGNFREFPTVMTPFLMLVVGGFVAFAVVLFASATWTGMRKD